MMRWAQRCRTCKGGGQVATMMCGLSTNNAIFGVTITNSCSVCYQVIMQAWECPACLACGLVIQRRLGKSHKQGMRTWHVHGKT
jgi:exosome complex RNA-binding protein Csl4